MSVPSSEFRKDRNTQAFLSIAFITGYFFTLYIVLTNSLEVPDKMLQVLYVLVGVETAEVTHIMAFWFGSSMGSKDKDVVLAEKKPIP